MLPWGTLYKTNYMYLCQLDQSDFELVLRALQFVPALLSLKG